MAFLKSDLLQVVLGPSAKYLGGQLQLLTQTQFENLKNIFEKARKKLPEEFENKGAVSPQIVKDILFDGVFCEDEISQEYYAGVLSSSKVEQILDNRGKTLSTTIKSLSSYQLTMHYILYQEAWNSLGTETSLTDQKVFHIETGSLLEKALLIQDESDASKEAIFDHVFSGLESKNLVSDIEIMNKIYLSQYFYQLTPSGIELFLWANGLGRKTINHFFSKEFLPVDIPDINYRFGMN